MRHLVRYYWILGATLGVLLILLGVQLPISSAGPAQTPILLVTNSAAPSKFGAYLGEILRAEGLDAFDVLDLSAVDATALAQHDLTILAYTPLTSAQANLFIAYVNGGGRLLAMRPDAQLNSLFGLGSSAGTLNNGYLQINGAATFNGAAPGQGLTTATLQIHGGADLYTLLPGATAIAQLYSNATTQTVYPAVVGYNYGGGQGVAFAYDLAQNVAYTRQGNPANANLDVDGDGITRTVDLFQTVGGGAPWVDRNKIPVPQADEQQRLFARLVKQLVAGARPLPQLWYFPGAAKTMLILTGDAHANPASYYQYEINSVNSHGGKITFYLSIASAPTDSAVQTWSAQGEGFGIHPYADKPDPYPPYNVTNLSQGYDAATTWFSAQYTSLKSQTVRNHQVAWLGWTDAADLAASHGISMDTSFYHWGNWLQKSDGTWPHGYITGSGQPMKFIRADGTLVPVYQQLTELVDEQLVLGTDTAIEGLNGTQAIAVSRQLIDSSLAGDYAALVTQFHVDYYQNGDPQVWAEGTMDYARSQGVPIWNADRWLSFVQTRHDANYTNVAWNNASGTLTFNLVATPTSGITLTTILPLSYSGRSLQSVTVDGSAFAFSVQTVNGVSVAFVSAPAGNHSFSAAYQIAPDTPTPTDTPTATPTTTPASPTPTPTPTSAPTVQSTDTVTSTPALSSFVDTTVADFGSGTPDSDIYLAQTGDGELILTPTVGAEFSGSALPAGWSSDLWNPPTGTVAVSGGALILDGARAGTDATYGPSRTLEFAATFDSSAPYQHVGFAVDLAQTDWAIFSTYNTGGNLYARTYNSLGDHTDTPLGSGYLGAPHLYRIDWTASGVNFIIDGNLVASHPTVITATMRPLASDANEGDGSLSVDWLRMSPYAATGAFISRVFDAGDVAAWLNLSATVSLPVSTTASFNTRISNDGVNWSPWQPISGTSLSGLIGRYLQYQALLATTDPQATPMVEQIVITCTLDADLQLVKTAPPVVVAGSSLTYTLNVTNDGPNVARGVTVTDALPAGVAFDASHSSLACAAPGNLATCSLGDLAPNASTPLTIVAAVGPSTAAGALVNTATVTATTHDPGLLNNQDSVTTTVSVQADLSITKTVSSNPAIAGSPLTYTLTVTNSGPSDASGVEIVDTLPAGVTFISATYSSGSCNDSGGIVTCAIASLARNTSARITTLVKVNPETTDPLTNAAQVTAASPDPDTSNNTATAATLVQTLADLAIGKSGSSDPAYVSAGLTYTLNITNAGPSVATAVVVTDSLPASVTFNGVAGAGWACDQAGGTVTCTAPSLTVGVAPAIVITVTTPAAPRLITNTTSISSATLDPKTTNNTAYAYTTVADAPISGLAATSDSPTTLGQLTTLTATVTDGSNVSYIWALGDGATAAGRVATHTYPTSKIYTAIVTATNSAGSVTATTPITITNLPPVASAGSNQTVPVSSAVTLDGSGSYDPDGHLPLTYDWRQTSGSPVILSNYTISQPTFIAPDVPAVLTFTLIVTDARGLASTPAQVIVTVADQPIIGLSAANDSPTMLGYPTTFTATLTGGTNVTYTWAFGDGATGIGVVATHTFNAGGVYTAIVTATNASNTLTATTQAIVRWRIYLPLVAHE